MQRLLFALSFLLTPIFALAAGWEPYVNGRFGYAAEIPPGFTLSNEADNGDGRTYANGGATLAIWGHYLTTGPFGEEVADRRATYEQEGWDLSYDRQKAGWASLSGTRGDRILYHRVIRLCDDAVASFVLEYPLSMKAEISPFVGKLVKSLHPAEGCTAAQGAAPAAQ
ncbi:hypothetical protein MUO32_07895 [Shinella sp. CPCC 101442]|uniref:hypothetical protein n=1 Tax=Shinella sp. CPCC 101442 TaxID=2932265 RepID=UPI0021524138|nr:hypothetical protein [Shinella sp. CPCC 101442]MCR6498948.1 hypothetical protein [Shinella sp. CPCC 101442]